MRATLAADVLIFLKEATVIIELHLKVIVILPEDVIMVT